MEKDYIKNIFTVAGGVFMSQILTILISPILTRIFSSESFGIIAVFLAIVNVLTVIATFRIENILFLPDTKEEAFSLLNLLIKTVIIFSIIFCLASFFLPLQFSILLFGKDQSHWFYWIPLLVVLNGLFYGFRNWLQSIKKYRTTTFWGIVKSIILNGILLIGGYFSSSPEIFLIANIIAQTIETGFLFIQVIKNEGSNFSIRPRHEFNQLFFKYKNFPKYALPADLLNVYANQNPIVLLAYFFNSGTVGFFSLTQRVIGIPIKLVTSSTSEVFKQKASEEYNLKGNCKKSFFDTFSFLLTVSILPTIIIVAFSPFLFELVFGPEWIEAGVYARYLSIMFFFRFCISPLGFTLMISQKQKWNLIWQSFLLIVTSLGIYTGVIFDSPRVSILSFSIVYSFMYLIYFFISLRAAKGFKEK
ncbi:lipopolysaccharide biosynthesis protein [Aquiflexum gelatinilyticum]|uniref:Oligosaccharide flippase family protein n=1 Tax=Aquiflexum gelatinilyticum TaxID=2961943 RepID=A0A9X2P9V3_9BACT|nr:oligosaccharide flippase family protein [Aquiflexum gelatinilyticum]MCR9014770.1 oligosaccharide flippase family protein [Aquiflexum gelatinilyticum]